MYNYSNLINKINTFSKSLAGIFSYADLVNVIGRSNKLNNIRTINHLVGEKALYKIKRGLYITPDANLEALAMRIKKKSYISMETILATNAMIGSNPKRLVSIVYPGIKKAMIETPVGLIRCFPIKKDLFFGFSKDTSAICSADPEKAYIDTLYYYTKGNRFIIDPLNEINTSNLNIAKIKRYLKFYQNKKFITFVTRTLNETKSRD